MCARVVISIAVLAFGGVLLLFTDAALSANCDKKPDHPQCAPPPPPPPPPGPGQASCPGDFPAFAYVTDQENKQGRFQASDIHVANSVGTCSITVYSTSVFSIENADFSVDPDSGRFQIAWNLEKDDGDGRRESHPNIRLVEFTVTRQDNERVINEPLPLPDRKLYRYSGTAAGIGIQGNDISDNQLVFGLEECFAGTPPDSNGFCQDSIFTIDIADCKATFGPEPDDLCADLTFAADPDHTSALYPIWGVTGNRIYFQHRWLDDPAPGEFQDSISFIERISAGAPWSQPPRAVVKNVDDISNAPRLGGDHDIGSHDVILWDHDLSGAEEVIAVDIDNLPTRFFAIGSGCVADILGSDQHLSCVTLTTAHEIRVGMGILGVNPKWTTNITLQGSISPNLLTWSDGIYEFDPDSGGTTLLLDSSQTTRKFDSVVGQANGSATLSWIPPTENTDMTPLTDLAGYKVYYGRMVGDYPNWITISDPGISMTVVGNLWPGTWHFVVTAFNTSNIESDFSNVASRTIGP